MPTLLITTLFDDFNLLLETTANSIPGTVELVQPTEFVSVYFQDEDGATFADVYLPGMTRVAPTIRVLRQAEVDGFDRKTGGIRLLYGFVLELAIQDYGAEGDGEQSIRQISEAVRDWPGVGVVVLR